eukprot:199521-Rhodomonas_salina.1
MRGPTHNAALCPGIGKKGVREACKPDARGLGNGAGGKNRILRTGQAQRRVLGLQGQRLFLGCKALLGGAASCQLVLNSAHHKLAIKGAICVLAKKRPAPLRSNTSDAKCHGFF